MNANLVHYKRYSWPLETETMAHCKKKYQNESESEWALLTRYVYTYWGICYSDRSATVQEKDSN